jgi:hypothetical protein
MTPRGAVAKAARRREPGRHRTPLRRDRIVVAFVERLRPIEVDLALCLLDEGCAAEALMLIGRFNEESALWGGGRGSDAGGNEAVEIIRGGWDEERLRRALEYYEAPTFLGPADQLRRDLRLTAFLAARFGNTARFICFSVILRPAASSTRERAMILRNSGC